MYIICSIFAICAMSLQISMTDIEDALNVLLMRQSFNLRLMNRDRFIKNYFCLDSVVYLLSSFVSKNQNLGHPELSTEFSKFMDYCCLSYHTKLTRACARYIESHHTDYAIYGKSHFVRHLLRNLRCRFPELFENY